jgi:glycosyltransferase involved in cell wall biosynthesis
MVRLAYLCEYPALQGGERSLLATVPAVRAAGFEPFALAPATGALAAEFARRDIEVVAWDVPPQDTLSPGSASASRRRSQATRREALAATLRYCGAELLHANSLSMGRLSGPVASEMNLPSLAHLRDIVGLSRQAVADLNRHRRLLAVSQATRSFHAAQGVTEELLHVLHNGVDLERFAPREPSGYLQRELELPPDAMLLGTIGQICLRKGHDLLLDAAFRRAADDRRLHFLVVGSRHSQKEESRRFQRRLIEAAQGPLAGRLHLLGERNDVPELLGELALVVHPARQEPLGRVLLEAAASGVPVVATEVGGTAEIFPPGSGAAMLVPPDEPAALASAIARLAGDPSVREEMRIAARRRVEQAFDARFASEGLVAHYREVMDR